MSQENNTGSTLLLTFLAGAALGALVVGLTTPKTGAEVRDDLKTLGRRARRKAEELADEAEEALETMKERAALAATDLKRGVKAAATDLRG
jgi:gas vesicle protein